jgi:hypothetical protein
VLTGVKANIPVSVNITFKFPLFGEIKIRPAPNGPAPDLERLNLLAHGAFNVGSFELTILNPSRRSTVSERVFGVSDDYHPHGGLVTEHPNQNVHAHAIGHLNLLWLA